MLVIFITAAFLIAATPPEYTEKHRVSGDANISAFNFVLPLVECPDKRGVIVGEKIKKVLATIGLDSKGKYPNRHDFGRAWVTSDKGSENEPAMAHLFGAGAYVMIHCGAHGLNLVLSHACEVLPGRRERKVMKDGELEPKKLMGVFKNKRTTLAHLEFFASTTTTGSPVVPTITRGVAPENLHVTWPSAIVLNVFFMKMSMS